MRQTLREFTRNNISNNDPVAKPLLIKDIPVGGTFYYKNGSPNNVYMRTEGDNFNETIYLANGKLYGATDGEVVRVESVTIQR